MVQFINKMERIKSPALCLLRVLKVRKLAIQNNITLKAAHVAGHLNSIIDMRIPQYDVF